MITCTILKKPDIVTTTNGLNITIAINGGSHLIVFERDALDELVRDYEGIKAREALDVYAGDY